MSTTTTEPIGAKGSRVFGGAASAEALASSPAVLRPSGLLAAKGLQQHYTPVEAATLAGRVMGAGACNVVDLTAGDGALMGAWPADLRYGVELDADQVRAGDYKAIHGDLQRVYPLLRLTGAAFRAVVLNPPFGLDWTDAEGKTVNSTIATLRYGLGVLDPMGQGMLIAGRDRFARAIAQRPEAAGVYAVIECPDLFEDVQLPCVLAFFCQPHRRKPDTEAPEWRVASRAELPELADWLADERVQRCGYMPLPRLYAGAPIESREHAWSAVNREHAARRNEAQRSSRRSHDLTMVNRRLHVSLSTFSQIALARTRVLDAVRRLHGQSVSYFAYNAREWTQVLAAHQQGAVTVAPDLIARVEPIITDARVKLVPNYPIKPQQRLGFLDDLDSILCTADDAERGYLAGERYPLSVESKVQVDHGSRVHETRDGEHVVRRFRHERKLLHITIGPHSFDEEPGQIAYLLEHFEVPDPGDLATLYPDTVEAMREVLRGIERDYGMWDLIGPLPEGRIRWKFKNFQLEDLARMLVKKRGLLSHEQGLGKTIQMMALALALGRLGCQDAALFVVPQDLIPQWQDEAAAFYGRPLTIVRSPAHARTIARDVAAGAPGWFLVHMEGLSLTGKRLESMDLPQGARSRSAQRPTLIVNPADWPRLAPEARKRAVRHPDAPLIPTGADTPDAVAGHALTSAQACPSCLCVGRSAGDGDGPARWDATRCLDCGYVHTRLRVHTAGHWLSTAFRRGGLFVDEIQNAVGDSLRSDAVCGLQGDHKFGGTGTPIKNYVNDAFKLLWWSLGNASEQFPYDFHDGRTKFERDFCVIEHLGPVREGGNTARKVLPRVTNLSMLWRLLCGGMIRRRKEDTGEPLQPLTIHPIWVPPGESQSEMNRQWARSFCTMFEQRHPGHPLVEAGMVDRFEAALGLLWKLEYAATLPAADPDLDWLVNAAPEGDVRDRLRRVSNWTPAQLKVLELAMRHVRQGEKVVIFSDLIDTGVWLAEHLCSRGVNADHIVEQRQGKASTISPAKRAKKLREFRYGATQVLCTGIKAVKQGHNLDTASVAIFIGDEWSHEARSQAMARVHRLTSKKPVNVYEVRTTGQFISARKHELLTDKGASSDLALDGALIEQDEQEVSWQQVVEQMKRQGFHATADEIPEADVYDLWQRAEGDFAPIVAPQSADAPDVTEPVAVPDAPAMALPFRGATTLAPEVHVALIESDSGQFALAI